MESYLYEKPALLINEMTSYLILIVPAIGTESVLLLHSMLKMPPAPATNTKQPLRAFF